MGMGWWSRVVALKFIRFMSTSYILLDFADWMDWVVTGGLNGRVKIYVQYLTEQTLLSHVIIVFDRVSNPDMQIIIPKVSR